MKLFFCDICNESIPLQDIKENRSTTIKGKIFCRGCNPLNELGGPDSPSGGASGGGGTAFLALVCLALAGAVGYLYYDLKFAPSVSAPAVSEARVAMLESTLDDMKMVLKGIQAAYDGLEELQGVPAQIQSLRDEGSGRSKELTRLTSEMNAVQAQLVAVGNLRDRVEGMALRQDEASSKIDSALAAVDRLQGSIQELGSRPPVIVERKGAVEEAAAGAAAPDEELLSIIERLSSDAPMTRWEAVDQIRRRKDTNLAGHILPLLDDRDTFVRAQAIYTLGELKADKAVSKLIKLLRDDESMISEEALTSLVVITGQNFKFDVNGSKAVRDKGIKRWEEWLGKNRDRYGS